MDWQDSKRFRIDGVRFFATVDPAEYHSCKSTAEEFLIVKNREMIERELVSAPNKGRCNVLDIGIWQGGSVALYDLALRPQKLVALEYNTNALEPLATYISQRRRGEIVRPYYGVNQGDAHQIRTILDLEFGQQTIDLVIDDASHFYAETRSCFNTVFPYLSKGGRYAIEDWAWSHHAGWTLPYFENKPAVTNLLLEIAALSSTRPDLVSEVLVTGPMFIVTKGPGTVPADFDIGDWVTNKGVPLAPVL